MLRKGALEAGLGEIMLTVLVAAVISGAMFGPLGAKVGEGFKEAERFTNVNTTVVVDDKETLGELLKYNYWRAWNCEDIESETFNELKSTSLTDDGAVPCAGAGSTLAKGVSDIWKGNTGQDMEGKYGRIKFEINSSIQPFTVKTGEAFGPSNAATIAAVSTGDGASGNAGYNDWLFGSGCWNWQPLVSDNYKWGFWDDKQKIIAGEPESFFSLFFKNGGGSSRINKQGNGVTIEDRYQSHGQNDGLYCKEYNDPFYLTSPHENTGYPKDESKVGNDYVEITLCPGDKGYIETRKHSPHNAGEAEGDFFGVANPNDNGDNLYGMIQITDMNSSCTVGSSAPSPNQMVLNNLNSPPDSYDFNNDRVLYEESGTNVFKPDDSFGDDQMVWSSLPAGSKTMSFDVYFETRGHFRIDVIDSSNDRVTNINTDATGDDKVWMYCRTCDDSNNPPFQDAGDTLGDAYGVVANYQTGEEYTIELSKTGTNVEWEMTDSSGNVVWEHSKDMNGDFNRVELEAWESWSGGTTDDTVVRINDIRIN